jgi:hypothetical protein
MSTKAGFVKSGQRTHACHQPPVELLISSTDPQVTSTGDPLKVQNNQQQRQIPQLLSSLLKEIAFVTRPSSKESL